MKMTSRTVGQLNELNREFTNAVADGVNALQAGQRRRARQLFGQIVRENPDNATAWLWLSRTVDDERQKQDCLDRVRQLDQARYALVRDAPTSVRDRDSSVARRQDRRALAGVLAAVIIVLACAGQNRVTKDALRQARRGFDWPMFLEAVERADTPEHTFKKSGAWTLQINREMLVPVNKYSGTSLTLAEVAGNRDLARWCAILYLRLKGVDDDYERATLVWAEKSQYMGRVEAQIYWESSVRPRMLTLMRGPGG